MTEYPTVTVETECPVDPFGQPADLRRYVLGELDRIIAELDAPLNTGLIGRSIARQLRDILRAWPNVKVNLSFNEFYPEEPFDRQTST
jgi:hypothetical protein